MQKIIKITIPYDSDLSKNRRYAFYKSKMKNPRHKACQENITYCFKEALRESGIIPIKGKTLVEIMCFKKNMRGDISNFINPINDAIKECLPYDDNYFINKTDYEIDKNNPRIEIKVFLQSS